MQTHSAKTGHFQRLSSNGSALWRPHHLEPRPHRHQSGEITPSKPPTRRRHAARRLRMARKPPSPPAWGAPRNRRHNQRPDTSAHQAPRVWRAPEGYRARLRCPWAVAGPGRTTSRRATQQQPQRPHWYEGRRRARRARAGFEIDHSERSSRVAISRAAGPDGARNTSGAPKTSEAHNETRPRPVARPRPRHAHTAPLSKAARRRSAPFTTALPVIRRSCPRDPRPRRGQPRGGRRGRGTGSRTRSRHPRCGRSGSTAGRHRARHTHRA